jgi:hypothetical protein
MARSSFGLVLFESGNFLSFGTSTICQRSYLMLGSGVSAFGLVTGDFYLDRSSYLASGRFPWMGTLASLSFAAAMLFASIKVLEKREF